MSATKSYKSFERRKEATQSIRITESAYRAALEHAHKTQHTITYVVSRAVLARHGRDGNER